MRGATPRFQTRTTQAGIVSACGFFRLPVKRAHERNEGMIATHAENGAKPYPVTARPSGPPRGIARGAFAAA